MLAIESIQSSTIYETVKSPSKKRKKILLIEEGSGRCGFQVNVFDVRLIGRVFNEALSQQSYRSPRIRQISISPQRVTVEQMIIRQFAKANSMGNEIQKRSSLDLFLEELNRCVEYCDEKSLFSFVYFVQLSKVDYIKNRILKVISRRYEVLGRSDYAINVAALIPDSHIKSRSLFDIGYFLYSQGDYSSCEKLAMLMPDPMVQSELFSHMVSGRMTEATHVKESLRKEALSEARRVTDLIPDENIRQFTDYCFIQRNLVLAQSAALKIGDDLIKSRALSCVAYNHLSGEMDEKSIEQAVKIALQIPIDSNKNVLLYEIAMLCLRELNNSIGAERIARMIPNRLLSSEVLAECAERYIFLDELVQAKQIASSIPDDRCSSVILSDLADIFLRKRDIKSADEIACLIPDLLIKKSTYEKIANYYRDLGLVAELANQSAHSKF
jgi:hypothetical protein